MKKCKNILKKALAITFGAALLTSCCLLDHSLKNIGEDVALEMSFATKGTGDAEVKGEELVGIENDVNTLRIYIFLDEGNDRRLAGHYYTDDPVLAPAKMTMDMTVFREGQQNVKFYVIANEKAMLNGSNPVTLSESTTEDDLNKLSFGKIYKDDDGYSRGLPMFDTQTALVTVSGGTPVTESGIHKDEGHLALNAQFDFELKRPMAKLTVYAAKSTETSDETNLEVTDVTVTKGFASSNGLFKSLENPTLGKTSLPLTGAAVAKLGAGNKTVGSDKTDRTNRNNFTQVTESIYPFENAVGTSSPDDWQTEVENGAQLKITYAFNNTPQVGIVNLPPIKRNEHIVVNCVMIGNGTMDITLNTLPWDYNEREWNYTKDISVGQPIIWDGNTSFNEEDKVEVFNKQEVSFSFDIDTPVGATWYATLIPKSNALDAFKFKDKAGNLTQTVSGIIESSQDPNPVSLTIWHDDDPNQIDTDKALLRISVKTDAGTTVVHLGTPDVPEYTIIRQK